MKNKVKFVLSPYFIMYLPVVVFSTFIGNHMYEYFEPIGEGIINQYIIPFLKYYFTGFGIVAYWYIPFVMIIFLLSPIFISFIKLDLRTQLLIILPLLLISTLIHRPIEDSGYAAFHSAAYFLPIYLIGIVSSQQKSFIYSSLNGKEGYLFLIGIVIATISSFFGQVANLNKLPFSYEGFDLMIVQKIVLCFGFMIWLSRFKGEKNKFLNVIAENSFGIFFTHGLLLLVADKIKRMFVFSFPSNFFIYILVSLIIFSLSLGISLLIKRIFPSHSRYIVGS